MDSQHPKWTTLKPQHRCTNNHFLRRGGMCPVGHKVALQHLSEGHTSSIIRTKKIVHVFIQQIPHDIQFPKRFKHPTWSASPQIPLNTQEKNTSAVKVTLQVLPVLRTTFIQTVVKQISMSHREQTWLGMALKEGRFCAQRGCRRNGGLKILKLLGRPP